MWCCSTRARRRVSACCCAAAMLILLSFFLAIYLPLMHLLRGTFVRLTHIDVTDLCAYPMHLSLRAQVTNTSPVRVRINSFKLQLRGSQAGDEDDGRRGWRAAPLLQAKTLQPLVLHNDVDQAPVDVPLEIDTLDESAATQALAHLSAGHNTSVYPVTFTAKLSLRIHALAFDYTYTSSLSLADVLQGGSATAG